MDPQALAGFAAVSIALAFTPGADWAYCIAAGLGRTRIFPAIAGLIAGYGIHTLLLVAGMAALVASLPGLLAWMTIFGRSAARKPGPGPQRPPARQSPDRKSVV